MKTLFFIIFALTSPMLSQYQLKNSLFGNGSSTMSSPNYDINSTIGQAIIGFSSGGDYQVGSGFWYTMMMEEAPIVSSFSIFGNSENSASFSVIASSESSATVTIEYGTTSNVYDATFSNFIGDQFVGDNQVITTIFIGLTQETEYFAKAFVTNSRGSSTSTEESFWTLSSLPNSNSSSFIQEGEELNQIVLNYEKLDLNGADGYLLIRSDLALTALPENGISYSKNDKIGNGTVIEKIINSSQNSSTLNGLGIESSYFFSLIPYNFDGVNDETHHYLTTDVPQIVGYTIPTLGEWGMIGMVIAFAGFGLYQIRKA